MSRNTKNSSVSPFCKVCQDAGKPETEYRSHFTRESRDIKSKTVCPTLLALECRYCFKNGHTVKYCDVLKRNKQQQTRKEEVETRNIQNNNKSVQKGKSNNKYICLDMDSDEGDSDEGDSDEGDSDEGEQKNKQVEKEDFPSLCIPKDTRSQQNIALNYASALAKPVTKPATILEVDKAPKTISTTYFKTETIQSAPWSTSATQKTATKVNWAAFDSDSDEESEEEEENIPLHRRVSNEPSPWEYSRSDCSYAMYGEDDDW